MRVEAEVVDIRVDLPRESDVFWLDTNVLIKFAYSKYPPGRLPEYDRFLKDALAARSTFFVTGLNQAEMIHVIEKCELEAYNQANGTSVRPKVYRHQYVAERAQVVSEIEAAWGTVQSIAGVAPVSVDENSTVHALQMLKACGLDGYDLIHADLMFEGGRNQLLSDDGDFASVAGIVLFTANERVINGARSAGKLVAR